MNENKQMQLFGQILQTLRKNRKLSQEKLAEICELDRTYISMLERGTKNPTLPTLMKLSFALNIRLDHMLAKLFVEPSPPTKDKEIFLPIMGTSVSCGSPVGHDYIVEKEISLEKLVLKNPQETFFIKSSGNSMAPTIMDGDFLVVDKSIKPKHGQIVLAQIGNDFTIKRFIKNKNKITLQPENLDFSIIEIDKEECLICGVVTNIIRTMV